MTVQNLPAPKLHKSVFQARYEAKLEFYENLYPAARKFDEIPHWETNGMTVTLFDFDKHISVGIAPNSFSYSQDSADLQLESKYLGRIIDVLTSALRISKFTRLGLRRWYLIPVTFSFESLASILDLKLSAQDEKLQKIMPQKVKDLMYVTIRTEGDYTTRIVIGPTTNEQAPSLIPYDQQHHLQVSGREELYLEIKKGYPPVSVFLEVDHFQESENLSLDDARLFTQQATDRVSKLTANLNDYFFSTKVEM